jgi:hypothetical protein
VLHDLDVTGYGRYRMRVRPARMARDLAGRLVLGRGEAVSRRMDGSWLLFSAGESVFARR